MKRIYLLSLLAGIAFFTSIVLNPAFHDVWNRWGKKEFYVYVVDSGKKLFPENIMRCYYEYRLPAIDENGTQKTLTFTSDQQLSLDTYLRLYVSSADKVTAWEEIPKQELPDRIKNENPP